MAIACRVGGVQPGVGRETSTSRPGGENRQIFTRMNWSKIKSRCRLFHGFTTLPCGLIERLWIAMKVDDGIVVAEWKSVGQDLSARND